MKIRKAIRQQLKALGIPDKAVSRTNGGHLKIEARGCLIFTGSTPSCPRAVKNMVARIRRAK